MFHIDPMMMRGIISFLLPVGLGAISYMLATLAAWYVSPVPRHLYYGRLIFLALFVFLIWEFYVPGAVRALSGPIPRYYQIGAIMRNTGTGYGMQTLWIWCGLALIKWPRNHKSKTAAVDSSALASPI